MFEQQLAALKLAEKTIKKSARTEEKEIAAQKRKEIANAFHQVDFLDEIKIEHIFGLALLLKEKYNSSKIDLNSIENDQERNAAFIEKNKADNFLKELAEKNQRFQEARKKVGRPKKETAENTSNHNDQSQFNPSYQS